MKLHNAKAIVIILLLSIASHSFGQIDFRSGFIITPENDTLIGELAYRSNARNYQSCIFKGEQAAREYFPEDINGFGYFDDKFFSSQIIDHSFVEVLVLGDISLYKTKDKYYLQKDSILFELETIIEQVETEGKLGQKTNNWWRGMTSYLVSDCIENPSEVVAGLRLNEKNLTNLVVDYNQCKGSAFKEFKRDKSWATYELGASLGLTRYALQPINPPESFYYLGDTYSSIDPTIGVIMGISSPRINEKLALQGEVHFIKSSFSSLVVLNRSSILYEETFINLQSLSIPISLRYSFPKIRYGWYFQGGLNFDYHLSSETKLMKESVMGNIVYTFPERPAFVINSRQVGLWGGMGVYRMFRGYKIHLAVRYFQVSSLNDSKGFKSNNSRISINLNVVNR